MESDHAETSQPLDNETAREGKNTAETDPRQAQAEQLVSIELGSLRRARWLAEQALAATVCESPMERRLLASLLRAGFDHLDWACDGLESCVAIRNAGRRDAMYLFAQVSKKVDGRNCRFDFMVMAFGATDDIVEFAIEVDGHDFHERTKEQAERDKSRDRAAQRAGIQTLRFTGSEVFRDPDKCAREIIDTVLAATKDRNAS